MNESRKMNFRIEDAITEAYEQMNEAHCGTGRKDEVKKPPMHYVIYDKKTKEVYAASTKPFDKFKLDDVADDMKVKKSDLVMKKMKKGQEVDSKLKESHCGTHRKDEVKSDKLSSAEYQKAKKLKGFNKKDWKWDSKEGLYLRVEEVNEAKFDKLRKKLKYINPETLQDVLDGKIKLNPAEKKEFDMFMRDARKMFSASTEEVNEAPGRYSKKGDQDKYQWGDINKAMMSAGMNPSSILKVLSKLRGKALGEEINEQLSAKFSKDFDKEAKEKGPHQDSSVYKQMRNIIKTQGFANVKTDKGSLKVDMQSAYMWLASYHMLSDKNKKNLLKMAQRSKDSLATTIRVAQTLTVKR